MRTISRIAQSLPALFVAIGLSAAPARAAAFDPIPVGARAVGMGGAFVAVADDGMAAYYNPAGLARLTRRHVETNYSDLYNLGLINRSHLSYAHPKLGKAGIAVGWNNLSTSQKVRFIDYSENVFGFSLGYPIYGGLSAGTTLNYYWVDYDKRAAGYGFDLALLLRVMRDFKVGVMMRNASHPKIRWQTGAIDQIPITWETGIAYEMTRRSLFAIQWNRSAESNDHSLFKLGAEYWLQDKRAPLRVGFRTGTNRHPGGKWSYMGGFSAGVKGIDIVYALQYHFDLDEEHTFSVNFAF